MINDDGVTRENIKEHIPYWRKIPDHPCRILRTGGSGSRKTNALLNLLSYY